MSDLYYIAGPRESAEPKNVRGKNICKNVGRLKLGEKLRVTFYQNRVVGNHHISFVRHLGILVRDRNMCPLRVHSRMDIKKDKLEHMWNVVTVRIFNNTFKKNYLENCDMCVLSHCVFLIRNLFFTTIMFILFSISH